MVGLDEVEEIEEVEFVDCDEEKVDLDLFDEWVDWEWWLIKFNIFNSDLEAIAIDWVWWSDFDLGCDDDNDMMDNGVGFEWIKLNPVEL